MKAPDRLFSSDPELARLHEILERDEPPGGALERATARVLGGELTAGAGRDASTTHDAAAAREGTAAQHASDARDGSSHVRGPRASLGTWGVVGLGAVVLVVAGTLAGAPWRTDRGARGEALPSAAPQADPLASAAMVRAPAPQAVEVRPPEPSLRVDDLPSASPVSRSAGAPSPTAPADPVLEELALVERARAALASGRGRECLSATKSYETKYAKRGLFGEEVEVMHIEALSMSGEQAAARARGQRFLSAHPDTPYAERLRRVLDEAAQ